MGNTVYETLFGKEEDLLHINRQIAIKIGIKAATLLALLESYSKKLLQIEDGYFCYFEQDIKDTIGFSIYVQRKLLRILANEKYILIRDGNQGIMRVKINNL